MTSRFSNTADLVRLCSSLSAQKGDRVATLSPPSRAWTHAAGEGRIRLSVGWGYQKPRADSPSDNSQFLSLPNFGRRGIKFCVVVVGHFFKLKPFKQVLNNLTERLHSVSFRDFLAVDESQRKQGTFGNVRNSIGEIRNV